MLSLQNPVFGNWIVMWGNTSRKESSLPNPMLLQGILRLHQSIPAFNEQGISSKTKQNNGDWKLLPNFSMMTLLKAITPRLLASGSCSVSVQIRRFVVQKRV